MHKTKTVLKRMTAVMLATAFVLTSTPLTQAHADDTEATDDITDTSQALADKLLAQLRKDNGDKKAKKNAEDFMLTDEPVEIDRGTSIKLSSVSYKFTKKNLKKNKASVKLTSFTPGSDAPVTVSGQKITANSPLKTAVKVTYKYHKKKTVTKKVKKNGKTKKVKKTTYAKKISKKVWLLAVTACPDENPGYEYDGDNSGDAYNQAGYASFAEDVGIYTESEIVKGESDNGTDDGEDSASNADVDYDKASDSGEKDNISKTNKKDKSEKGKDKKNTGDKSDTKEKGKGDKTTNSTKGDAVTDGSIGADSSVEKEVSSDGTSSSTASYTAPTYTELKEQAVEYIGLTSQESIDLLDEIMSSSDFYNEDRCGKYCHKGSGWMNLHEFQQYYQNYWQNYIYESLPLTDAQREEYSADSIFSVSYKKEADDRTFYTNSLDKTGYLKESFDVTRQKAIQVVNDLYYGYNDYDYNVNDEVAKAQAEGRPDCYIQIIRDSKNYGWSLGIAKWEAEQAVKREETSKAEDERIHQEMVRHEEEMKAEQERLRPMYEDLTAKQVAAVTKNADTEYMKFMYIYHYAYGHSGTYVLGEWKPGELSDDEISDMEAQGYELRINAAGNIESWKGGYKMTNKCQDQADYLYHWCTWAGIECKVVGNGSHAFCEVVIDGQHYSSDPTWSRPLMSQTTDCHGEWYGKKWLALNTPEGYSEHDGTDFGDMPDYQELMKQYYPEEYEKLLQRQQEDTKRRYPDSY